MALFTDAGVFGHDDRRAPSPTPAYDHRIGGFGSPPPVAEPPDTSGVAALTLDEVTYDRDTNWCARPEGARSRAPLARSRLFATAARAAAANAPESAGLDAAARAAAAAAPKRSQPCAFFARGRCRRGAACAFAHARPPTTKAAPRCTFFAEGRCARGAACRFAHDR